MIKKTDEFAGDFADSSIICSTVHHWMVYFVNVLSYPIIFFTNIKYRQDKHMRYDAGTIVTIVCVLLFYLRLIVIQRHRVKTARIQYAEVVKKNSKKKGGAAVKPEIRYPRLGIHIHNWWLVGAALTLIIFGGFIAATQFLGPSVSRYWWIPLNIGIGLFALGVN